jgi:hypothetical protein
MKILFGNGAIFGVFVVQNRTTMARKNLQYDSTVDFQWAVPSRRDGQKVAHRFNGGKTAVNNSSRRDG